MHYDVSYKGDDSPRRAILDWAQYVGPSIAIHLARIAAGRGPHTRLSLKERWDWFNIGSAFNGVRGYPVREAFKHFAKITQQELEAIPD